AGRDVGQGGGDHRFALARGSARAAHAKVPQGVASSRVSLGGRSEILRRRPFEDAPAHVEARAVAWAVPRALDAIPVHDAAHVRAHGRALPEPAIGLAIDGQSLLAAAYDGRATGRDLIARIQLPALEIFGEPRDRGRALLRDLESGVERLPSWIEYGGPDVVL